MSRRPNQRDKTPPRLLLPSQRARQQGSAQDVPHPAAQADTKAIAHPAAQATAQAKSDSTRTAHAHRSSPQTHFSTDSRSAPPISLPLGPDVRLLAWHPCGLYVLDKPEGVLSHPNKKSEISRSLLLAPYSLEHEYFYNLQGAASTQQNDTRPPAPAQEAGAHKNEGNNWAQPSPTAPAQAVDGQPVADSESTPTAQAAETTPTAPARAPHAETAAAAATTAAETVAADARLYLLHRLDSATSGLLLLADNEALANSIRTAFADGSIRKTYFALCAATTSMRAGQKGRWSDRLQREHSGSSGGVVHVKTSNSGQSAVTDFTCRKTSLPSNALALLELHPLSGRTHQLRVHCAQHGLPIIGDAKYGDFRLNRAIAKDSGHKRLFLHAAALDISFTLGGKKLHMQYAATLPTVFEALLHNPPEISRACAVRTPQQAHGGTRRNSPANGCKARPQQQGGRGGKRRPR